MLNVPGKRGAPVLLDVLPSVVELLEVFLSCQANL